MKKRLILLLSIISLSIPELAGAQVVIHVGHNPFADYKNTGIFYVGVGSGSAKAEDETFFGQESVSGGMVLLGFKLGPYAALELGSLSFADKQDTQDDPSAPDSQPGTVVSGQFTSILLRYPMQNFGAYARVSSLDYNVKVDGVNQYEEDQTTTGVGLGLDWFITEWWSVRLEAEKYKEIGLSKTDITFTRFGVNFHF